MSEPSPPGPARRRRRVGVRDLLILVACAGAVSWSYRSIAYRTPTRSFSRMLQVGTVEERRTAARELYNSVHGEIEIAVPALLGAAHDEDATVRAEAVESLGLLGAEAIRKGPTANPADRPALDSAERSARAAALSAADDPSPRVREKAMRALMFLFYAWQGLGAKGYAAQGEPLPEIEPGPYLPRILAALDDPDIGVRDAAGRSIAFFPRHLDPALPTLLRLVDADATDRPSPPAPMAGPRVALLAARPGEAAVPTLVRALKAPGRLARCHAAILAGKVGPGAVSAVPALVEALEEPPRPGPRPVPADDPAEAAARALARVARGTPESGRAVSALIAMLGSDLGRRRMAAAQALAEFGPDASAAAPRLAEVLRASIGRGAEEGPAAADALGRVAPVAGPSEDSVAALVEATAAADDQIVYQALLALTRLGPRAAAAAPRLRALAQPAPARPWLPRAAARALRSVESTAVPAGPQG